MEVLKSWVVFGLCLGRLRAYQLGAIANDLPLALARERARIDRDGVDLDDPAFSRTIRRLP